VASCGAPAPPPGPADTQPAAEAVERRADDVDRTRHHTPTIPLPAAAPVSTFGPNGERVDPIVSLQRMLDDGEVEFHHDPITGYLPALLAALDIPVSSQVLIFSRTSLQTERIAPWTPRAVYFNDDVYIGHVADDTDPMNARILEVASIDPDDGGAFYFLPQDPDAAPKFVREGQQCLMCHESGITEDVPGVMVRSVLTGRMGRPIIPVLEAPTTDRTPMHQRFAGWYVTGTGGGVHGGNVWAPAESHEIDLGQRARYLDAFDFSTGAEVTDLTDRFDTSIYLSEHSDIVALLVLAHQTRVHNIITLAHEQTREALRRQEAARITRGVEIAEGELLPTTEVAIDNAVDRLTREMLFSGAAPLEGPIRGTSGFTEEFEARGPFDPQGRTLRKFNLRDRLFEYPLSFLVYTDAFDALPELTKTRVYRRIDAVLSGRDATGDFDHLDAQTRAAIREILVATKPDFETALR
jgi:hypothetical protein